MTAEQLDLLRRQISVYSAICQQLVAMHQAMTHAQHQQAAAAAQHAQHAVQPQMAAPSHHIMAGYEPVQYSGSMAHSKSRQRWTPSPAQLQVLEKLFVQGNGTPNKHRIKEITDDLRQHGRIEETNVYNWFQNRKARAKRKQSSAHTDGGGSDQEVDVDAEEEREKKLRRTDADADGDDEEDLQNRGEGEDRASRMERHSRLEHQASTASVATLPQALDDSQHTGLRYAMGVALGNGYGHTGLVEDRR
eukprot:SM000029S10573  [mRNA]  locus=s29:942338:944053:- [translate_table: standard]